MNKDDAIKNAVVGTKDYHETMRSLLVTLGTEKAGFVPDKIENEPLPTRNNIHWQSREMNMGVGMLWIFFAVEYEHYTIGEAAKIWRYGQSLKFISIWRKKNPVLAQNKRLMDAIEYCIKNPNDFVDDDYGIVHWTEDEFAVRDIYGTVFMYDTEYRIDEDGALYFNIKEFVEITRLINCLRIWIYEGSRELSKKEKKQLYEYMGW